MILLSLLLLLIYSLACVSLGFLILNRLGMLQTSFVSHWAFGFILGQGTLASVWLLISMAGWFHPILVGGTIMVLLFVGGRLFYGGLVPLAVHLRSIWREIRSESFVWQGIILLLVVFGLYFFTIIGSGLTGDAMSFYMMVPKLTAASHRLTMSPSEDIAAAFGLQGELHYASLMLIGDWNTARLFDWPTIIAGAIMMMAICAKTGVQRRGQWIAFVMFITSYAVLHFAGQGKVDRFALGLALAAIFWSMQTGFSALTAYLAGMAVIAKLIYLPFFAPIIFYLAFWHHAKTYGQPENLIRQFMKTMVDRKLIVALTVGLFLAALPFLLKTLSLPFLLGHDETRLGLIRNPDPEKAIAVGLIPFSDMVRFYFRFPFDATFMLYESMSPLILAFIPLAFLLPKGVTQKFTPLWNITVAAFISTTIWMFLYPNFTHPLSMYYGRGLRYYLPSVLLFIPLAAYAAEHVSKQVGIRYRLLDWGVAFSVLLTLTTTMLRYTNAQVFFPVNAYKYLDRQISECGLPHEPNYCAVLKELNQIALPGERVLTNSNIYWLRPDLIVCAYDTVHMPLFEHASETWRWIQRNGFNYLIVNEYDPVLHNLVSSPVPEGYNITLVLEEKPNKIYRLEYADIANAPEKICKQVLPDVWEVVDR